MAAKLQCTQLEQPISDILNQYFTSDYRSGYLKYNDVILTDYFQEFGDEILNMNVRNDDVWVCSFPEAGTAWIQEMVWCISNNLDFERAKIPLCDRFPFLEVTSLFRLDMNSVDLVKGMVSPRFIKTQLPFNLLPEKLQKKTTNAKVIYVTRNAKDICVLYYNHCKASEGFKGDFKLFCELFMSDSIMYEPFWEHKLGYWKEKDNPNVMIITYEDMKNDLAAVVRKTVQFLGKSFAEDQLKKLIGHLEFDNMRKNTAVCDINNDFVKNSHVGYWKGMMDSDMLKRFDEWEQEKLSQLA